MSSHQAFTHAVEPTPGGATITVTGEMDLAAEIPIDALTALALQPGQVVSLRMADVSFIDSAGIHFLANVKSHVEATGATLVLVEPSHQVRRVLELTSLHDFFGVDGDGQQEGPGGHT
jgi:anti-sigma B factor antagonist